MEGFDIKIDPGVDHFRMAEEGCTEMETDLFQLELLRSQMEEPANKVSIPANLKMPDEATEIEADLIPLNLKTPDDYTETEADYISANLRASDEATEEEADVFPENLRIPDGATEEEADANFVHPIISKVPTLLFDSKKKLTKSKSRYNLGKTYDFLSFERQLAPKFDYNEEFIKAKQLKDLQKQLDVEPTDDEEILERLNEKPASEIGDGISVAIDPFLDDLTPEVEQLQNRLSRLISDRSDADSESTSSSDSDCSSESNDEDELEDDLSEGGDLPNEHWSMRLKRDPTGLTTMSEPVRGLRKLNILRWLSKRKKNGFVADRNLRENILRKGVDLKGEASRSMEMDKIKAASEGFINIPAPSRAYVATRNLQRVNLNDL